MQEAENYLYLFNLSTNISKSDPHFFPNSSDLVD